MPGAVRIWWIRFGKYFLVSIPNSSLNFNFIIFSVSSMCRMTQGDGKRMFSWSHFIAHVHVYHDLYQCSNLRVPHLQNVSHTFMYAFELDRHCDGHTFIYARMLATHIHVIVISSSELGALSSNPIAWFRNQEFGTYLLFFCHPRHVVIPQRHITEKRNPKTPEDWSNRGPEERKIKYNSNRDSQPHAIICVILRLFHISTVYQIAIVLHGPSIGHGFGWLPSLSAKR